MSIESINPKLVPYVSTTFRPMVVYTIEVDGQFYIENSCPLMPNIRERVVYPLKLNKTHVWGFSTPLRSQLSERQPEFRGTHEIKQ